MMNSLTCKRVTLTLSFSIAVLLLVLAVVLGVGVKNPTSLTALAEGEIVLAEGGDFSYLNVAKVGTQEIIPWGDAEYTITSKKGDGETLIAVYATYTTGKLAGSKVMLYEDATTGNYILYGVSGNFYLTGEWVATWFEPVWTYNTSQCTVTGDMPTRVQVGIGLPLEEMPSVDGTQLSQNMYYSEGWKVTGTLKNGSSYSLGYIPADAVSANCSASLTDATTYVYYTTTDVNDSARPNVVGEGVFNKDYNKSNGTPVGVYAAGDTTDPYSGIDSTVNTSGTKYRYGFLGHVSNSSRPYNKRLDEGCDLTFTNDAGATEYYNGMGFYREKTTRSSTAVYDHSMLVIPIRFDNALKRDLLAGTYSSIRVTVTARILVGAKNVSSNARTNAWLDLEEGIKPRLTDFSYSENSASVNGYPRTYINGEWKTDLSHAHNSSTNPATITSGYITSTSWGGAQGVYSKTIQTTATSGFTVGFRATYYTNSGNGVTKHFALINTMTYKVEVLDASGNASKAQSYTVNLDSNAPEGATVHESVKDGTEDTITTTSLDSSIQLNSVPWAYDGYEFTGWSTDSSATIGDKSLALNGTTDSSLTYYAIWQKRKYSYLEYDVYSDGTNQSGLIRTQVGVFEHGGTTFTDGNAIAISSAENGGNLYAGFTSPTQYLLPRGISGARADWMEWTSESTFDTTCPIIIAFERIMETPTVAIVGQTVEYGNSINLDDSLTPSHTASTERDVLYNYTWFNAEDEEVVFGGSDNSIYLVNESSDYKCQCVANVTIVGALGEVTLSKAVVSDLATFTITPAELVVTWTLDGNSLLVTQYDGQSHVMEASLSGTVYEDIVLATLDNASQINAGKYTAEIIAIDNENYVVAEADATQDYEITQVVVNVVWTLDGEEDVNSLIYDGNSHNVSAYISNKIGEDLVNVSSYDGTISATSKKNYTATILAIDNANYTIEGAENLSFDWSIEGIVLTANWTIGEYVYNGERQYPTLTISGFEEADAVYFVIEFYKNNALVTTKNVSGSGNTEYSFASTDATHVLGESIDAGNYTIKFNGVVYDENGEENFKYNNISNFAGQDYVIAKKTINATGEWQYSFNDGVAEDYLANTILEYAGAKYTLYTTLDESALCTRADTGIIDTLTIEYQDNEKTSAGDYTASISIASDNYMLGENTTFDWSIEPIEIALTWTINGTSNLARIFNGSNYYISATANGMLGGDSCNVTLSGENKAVESGTYTAIASGLSNSNYLLPAQTTQEWEILPLAVELTWDNASFEYDGSEKAVYATINNIKGNYTCEIEYEGNKATSAGNDYRAKIIGLSSNNYTLDGVANLTYDWSIAQKAVEVAWSIEGSSELTKTYRASAYTITATLQGVVNNDTCNVTVVGDKAKTYVGNYTATVESISNDNYVLSGSLSTSWEIKAIKVDITWSEADFTYDGNQKQVSATINNLISGDNLYFTYKNNAFTDAGDYIAQIESLSNSNYTIEGVESTYAWSIAQKELSIEWTLDGTSNFIVEYDGQIHVIDVIINDIIGSDIVNATLENNSNKIADKYTATLVSIDNDNYKIPQEATKDYEITKKVVALVWYLDGVQGNDSVVYDGMEHSVTATVYGAVDGEDITILGYVGEVVSGEGALTNGNVASLKAVYKTTVSGISDNVNYEISTDSISLEWSIRATELDIVFQENTLVYNGKAQGITAIVYNVSASNISGVTLLTTGSTATDISYEILDGKYYLYFNAVNSGDYTAIISGIDGEYKENYSLPEENSYNFSIAPKVVTLSWKDASGVYNKQNKITSATLTNLENSDLVNVEYKTTGDNSYMVSGLDGVGNVAVNAGEYLTEVVALDNDNYTLEGATELSKAWNISSKLLGAFTWSNATLTYNGNAQNITASVIGGATDVTDGKAYDGDVIDITYSGVVVSNYGASAISGNQVTTAGEYKVTIAGVGNDNYQVDTIETTLTVAKAGVEVVSSTDWSKVYDKTTEYLTYTYNGVFSGTELTLSAVYSDYNAGAKALTFSASGKDVHNYYLTFNGLTIDKDYVANGNDYLVSESISSIVPRKVTASGDVEKVFDGTTNANQFTVSNSQIIDGDVINVSAVYDSAIVGERNLLLTIDNTNYALEEATVQASITAKTLTIDWTGNGSVYTYNGAYQGVNAVVSGMVAGFEENLNVSGDLEGLLSGNIATINAGEYNVSLSLNTASNYTLEGTQTTASWTIGRKAISLDWLTDRLGSEQDDDYVYDFEDYVAIYSATARTIVPTLVGVVDGDDVSCTVSGTVATNAGDYIAEVSALLGDDKDNYELSGELTLEWSIVKADVIGVTFESDTFIYDKSLNIIDVSSDCTQFGEAFSVVYSGGENGNGAINVGTYQIEATIDAGSNYNQLLLEANLVIEKANMEGISLNDFNDVYDGTIKSISVNTTTTAFGDEIEVSYSLVGTTLAGDEISENANGIVKAGNYVVSALLSGGANYHETTLDANLIIAPREIVVSWQSYAYGESTEAYDGQEKGVTITIDNIVDGDDVKAILSTDAQQNLEIVGNGTYSYGAINVGGYALTLEEILGVDSVNYTYDSGIFQSYSFAIAPRALVIIGWSDGVKTYTDLENVRFTYAKRNVSLVPVFADGSIVSGDEENVNVVLSGNEGINAGEYITHASIDTDGNYVLASTTQKWYIDAKEIELVWENATAKNYNGKAHSLFASAKGLIDGDKVELTYANNGAINAGKYDVEVLSLGNANYKIAKNTAKKTLVINPVEILGIELLDKEIVFDGKKHGLDISKTETQYGDDVEVSFVIYDQNGNEISKDKVSEVGIYKVKVKLEAGKNYVIRDMEGNLTIKSLSIATPVEKEDEKATVNVESSGGFMPGSVVETTSTTFSLTDGNTTNVRLSAGERVALVYEVTVMYQNQESVLNGTASVKMLIPEELRGNDFRIVNLSNGEETELEYVVEDEYVLVSTTALDTFVFIYEPSPIAIVKAYSGWLALSVAIGLVLVIALVVIVFFRKTRTIKFVANGVEVEGGRISDVNARYGTKVDLPTPTIQGMCYKGWYADEDFTEKAGKEQRPTKKRNLYAKTMARGTKTKIPQAFIDGIKFEGWYEDEACTKKANVNKMGRKNLTLYAKWGKKKEAKLPVYPWEQ